MLTVCAGLHRRSTPEAAGFNRSCQYGLQWILLWILSVYGLTYHISCIIEDTEGLYMIGIIYIYYMHVYVIYHIIYVIIYQLW